MQGSKGASLSSTRRIWRTMARKLAGHRVALEKKRARRPGYDESKCLLAELVRTYERDLAPGSAPPVGVLREPWRQVCVEMHPALICETQA